MSVFDGEVLGTDTITVVRAGDAGGEDAYGNPVPGQPVRFTIAGCSLQPFLSRNTAETLTPTEDVVISRWRLFAPAGSDIRPDDKIECGGLTLQVDGDLMTWGGDEFDGDGYCETYLKRWSG